MRYEFTDITCSVSRRRSLIPSGQYLVFLWLSLIAVALLACTTLPKPGIKSLTLAYEPHPDRRLAAVSRDLLKGVGPETSGFFMLLRNNEALQWRLLLTDLAEETLDIQGFHMERRCQQCSAAGSGDRSRRPRSTSSNIG